MLAQYHRWIFENQRWESVETLKEFVSQEAEFQTVASETSSNRNADSRRNQSEKAFFGNAQESEIQKYRPCKVCKGHHGVWCCDKFKDLPVQQRWNTAKRLKLCFRCLRGDHHGQTCVGTRVCGINNCKDNNNRKEKNKLKQIKDNRLKLDQQQTRTRQFTAYRTLRVKRNLIMRKCHWLFYHLGSLVTSKQRDRTLLHLLLFIARKYAFISVKRRPTARRYVH